jgi:hypothetical protein
MTQETLYMVAEIGYEYNDEVYHRGESDSIIPVVLYRDKKKAEAEVVRRTLQHARSEELAHYSYGLEDLLRDRHARRDFEDLMVKYDPSFDMMEHRGWEGLDKLTEVVQIMTDDDLIAVLGYTSLNFFEVREVVLED